MTFTDLIAVLDLPVPYLHNVKQNIMRASSVAEQSIIVSENLSFFPGFEKLQVDPCLCGGHYHNGRCSIRMNFIL
jgi:hypothetical protein